MCFEYQRIKFQRKNGTSYKGEIWDLQAKLGLWDHFRTLVGTKTQISASKYQIFRQTLLKECGTWEHCVWEYPKNWVMPEISGNTPNSGLTQNIGLYPIFRVTCYPMIFKTESGRVGYRMKYRVAGRVRVPAGHWTQPSIYQRDISMTFLCHI